MEKEKQTELQKQIDADILQCRQDISRALREGRGMAADGRDNINAGKPAGSAEREAGAPSAGLEQHDGKVRMSQDEKQAKNAALKEKIRRHIHHLEQAKAQAQARAKDLEGELVKVQERLDNEKQARAAAQQQVQDNMQQISELKVQLEQSSERIIGGQKIIDTLGRENGVLQEQIQQVGRQMETVHAQIQAKLDASLRAEGENAKLIAAIRQDNARLQEQLNDISARYEADAEAKRGLERRVEVLEEDNGRLGLYRSGYYDLLGQLRNIVRSAEKGPQRAAGVEAGGLRDEPAGAAGTGGLRRSAVVGEGAEAAEVIDGMDVPELVEETDGFLDELLDAENDDRFDMGKRGDGSGSIRGGGPETNQLLPEEIEALGFPDAEDEDTGSQGGPAEADEYFAGEVFDESMRAQSGERQETMPAAGGAGAAEAVPEFNLAEQIMAEQRRITSARRKRSGDREAAANGASAGGSMFAKGIEETVRQILERPAAPDSEAVPEVPKEKIQTELQAQVKTGAVAGAAGAEIDVKAGGGAGAEAAEARPVLRFGLFNVGGGQYNEEQIISDIVGKDILNLQAEIAAELQVMSGYSNN